MKRLKSGYEHFESRCSRCGFRYNWKENFLQKPPCPSCGNLPIRQRKGLYGRKNERRGMIFLENEEKPRNVS